MWYALNNRHTHNIFIPLHFRMQEGLAPEGIHQDHKLQRLDKNNILSHTIYKEFQCNIMKRDSWSRKMFFFCWWNGTKTPLIIERAIYILSPCKIKDLWVQKSTLPPQPTPNAMHDNTCTDTPRTRAHTCTYHTNSNEQEVQGTNSDGYALSPRVGADQPSLK
jgi:hypothetical protein